MELVISIPRLRVPATVSKAARLHNRDAAPEEHTQEETMSRYQTWTTSP